MGDITKVHIGRFAANRVDNTASVGVSILRGQNMTELELSLPTRPSNPKEWQALALEALQKELGIPATELASIATWPKDWPPTGSPS